MPLTSEFITKMQRNQENIGRAQYRLHGIARAFKRTGQTILATELFEIVENLGNTSKQISNAVDDQMTSDLEMTQQAANETASFMLAAIELKIR